MPTLIRLSHQASTIDRDQILRHLEDEGATPRVHGGDTISTSQNVDPDAAAIAAHPAVVEVAKLEADLPLTAATSATRSSVSRVRDTAFSREGFIVIAGPCSVETPQQMKGTASAVKGAGAPVLRGGLYKPRTSPYSFQGLREEGFELVEEVKQETGLPFVTEVLDPRDVNNLHAVADMLQIGARNMQNFELLKEAGKSGIPVLLKRGMSATIADLLQSAEYVLDAGCSDLVLCERGIRTFETGYRFTLDLTAVPVLQEKTHLPVIVDPSHAPGKRRWVEPLALASAAAGADGVIVETHCNPDEAWSDAAQAYPSSEFAGLVDRLAVAAHAAGKNLTRPDRRSPSVELLPAA